MIAQPCCSSDSFRASLEASPRTSARDHQRPGYDTVGNRLGTSHGEGLAVLDALRPPLVFFYHRSYFLLFWNQPNFWVCVDPAVELVGEARQVGGFVDALLALCGSAAGEPRTPGSCALGRARAGCSLLRRSMRRGTSMPRHCGSRASSKRSRRRKFSSAALSVRRADSVKLRSCRPDFQTPTWCSAPRHDQTDVGFGTRRRSIKCHVVIPPLPLISICPWGSRANLSFRRR
jgi:hypothetical protein